MRVYKASTEYSRMWLNRAERGSGRGGGGGGGDVGQLAIAILVIKGGRDGGGKERRAE